MSDKIKVMIVDDDKGFIDILKKIFTMNKQFEATGYTDPVLALKDKDMVEYDILIVDLIMPGMNGLEFLAAVKQRFPLKHVIVLTGQGSIDTAVEAMQLGAFTFIEKPVNPDELIQKLFRVVVNHGGELSTTLKDRLLEAGDENLLIGNSADMVNIRKDARIIARTNSAVLITGESGTGKELVAELLYQHSPRKGKPFIKINCAALPETLFESELFGYVKGAFTGAHKEKKGKIEMADGGTLFLDEIGELSVNMQTKLLRVLQQKELEKIGSEETVKVDVRLICATNRNLQKEVEEGRFRDDLYYRINVISVHIPPLRDRKEDIPGLVEYYFKEFGLQMHKDIPLPSKEIMEAFMNYNWAGNVRELRNVIERIFVFARPKTPLMMSDLPDALRECGHEFKLCDDGKDLRSMRDNFERAYLLDMLKSNNWNVTRTAEQIGLSRRNLQKKIKALELKRDKPE